MNIKKHFWIEELTYRRWQMVEAGREDNHYTDRYWTLFNFDKTLRLPLYLLKNTNVLLDKVNIRQNIKKRYLGSINRAFGGRSRGYGYHLTRKFEKRVLMH